MAAALEGGISMASFRTIAALSVIGGACMLAAMSTATAQTVEPIQAAVAPIASANQSFKRCPKTADQYAELMKQLVSTAARARALADENPLLEPDAAYYQAELAATKKCAPTIATLTH
jgi:flagellar motor component MotA